MPHKFTIEDHEERMRKILTPPAQNTLRDRVNAVIQKRFKRK